jgi:hypothetical protein
MSPSSERALWTGGAVFGTLLLVGGGVWVAGKLTSGGDHRITLAPGTMHISGFKPGDNVTLVLPPGARWGGVTDAVDKPVGSEPFTFNDGKSATYGNIGATWWDKNGNAQATTITYGP